MGAARRRWVQLGALLLVLAIVVQYVVVPALGPTVPQAPAGTPARGGGRAAEARQGPVEVRLDALTRAAAIAGESANAAQRNPFRMGAAQPPPARPGSASGAPAMPKPPPVAPVLPTGPPPPPPIPYRFIGVLAGAPGHGRIAVLSDGKTVVHGQVNQEIDGRYRIVQIGEESLQIEHLDGRGRQTLRLLGQ
jgi:hypothetical protein